MGKIFRLTIGETHLFRKLNGVSQFDDKGQYDLMKCSECGIEGKCRDCKTVEIPRMNKRAIYCDMKTKDIRKIEAEAKYKSGIITKSKCPDCGTALVELAVYEDEETKDCFAEVICKCGHKDMINVTEREQKKIKKKAVFTMPFATKDRQA